MKIFYLPLIFCDNTQESAIFHHTTTPHYPTYPCSATTALLHSTTFSHPAFYHTTNLHNSVNYDLTLRHSTTPPLGTFNTLHHSTTFHLFISLHHSVTLLHSNKRSLSFHSSILHTSALLTGLSNNPPPPVRAIIWSID